MWCCSLERERTAGVGGATEDTERASDTALPSLSAQVARTVRLQETAVAGAGQDAAGGGASPALCAAVRTRVRRLGSMYSACASWWYVLLCVVKVRSRTLAIVVHTRAVIHTSYRSVDVDCTCCIYAVVQERLPTVASDDTEEPARTSQRRR